MEVPNELVVTSTYVLEPEISLLDYLHCSSLGTRPSFFLTTALGYGSLEQDIWTAVASGRYMTVYHNHTWFRVALTTWMANRDISSYFYVIPIDGDIPKRIRNSVGILRIRRDFVASAFCVPIGRPVFPDLSPVLEKEWDATIPLSNQLQVALTFPPKFSHAARDFVYFINGDEVSLEDDDHAGIETGTAGMVAGTGEHEGGGTMGRVKSEVMGGSNRNHIDRAIKVPVLFNQVTAYKVMKY